MSLTWEELRASVLVGTNRRPLTDLVVADYRIEPAPGDPEEQTGLALRAASLLRAQRLGGRTPVPAGDQAPGPAPETLPPAPPKAVDLLDEILRLSYDSRQVDELLTWFDSCFIGGFILPNGLVSAVLDRASQSSALRAPAVSCLGERGRWVVSSNPRWDWAERVMAIMSPAGLIPDPALLSSLTPAELEPVLARITDPTGLRAVVADLLASKAKSDRRQVALQALGPNLDTTDEPVLEEQLDGRSVKFRDLANQMLATLPSSTRSARLAEVLDGLVTVVDDGSETRTGRWFKRKKERELAFEVARPEDPEGDLARYRITSPDTRMNHNSWFRSLVGGVDLKWWEQKLDAGPEQIVGAKTGPNNELITIWSDAAIAQRNQEWALALLGHGATNGQLVAVLEDHPKVAAAFFFGLQYRSKNTRHVLNPGPTLPAGIWTPRFASTLLSVAAGLNDGGNEIRRLFYLHKDRFPIEMLPTLRQLSGHLDEGSAARTETVTTIKHLETKQAIIEAFL